MSSRRPATRATRRPEGEPSSRTAASMTGGLELVREQRVHDEVHAAAESRVVPARAQDSLLGEARLLRDLPGGDVLLVGAQLQPLDAVVRDQPARHEPHCPRADAFAPRLRRDPVADLGHALVGLEPAHADRADRLAVLRVRDREVRQRSVAPAFPAELDVRPRVRLGVRRRNQVEKLRDRAVVASRCDRLDVALLTPRSQRDDAVRQWRLRRSNGHCHTICSLFRAGNPVAEPKESRWRSSRTYANTSIWLGTGSPPAAASTISRRRRSSTRTRSSGATGGSRKGGRSWSTRASIPAAPRTTSSSSASLARRTGSGGARS